ncbi:hypothetical protein CVT26_002247 [Gymnopilus dilepis]|uniref:Uncharacterized protein n=1 Tax=Gymnopilus dilepis TaxID=231916 RepID=A0A409YX74_9AGAR|nr:hypothetical protein CVT26_002247 [Gymnopilus dilepis]
MYEDEINDRRSEPPVMRIMGRAWVQRESQVQPKRCCRVQQGDSCRSMVWDVAVPDIRMTVKVAAHIIELRDVILLVSKKAYSRMILIRVDIQQREQKQVAMIHEITTNSRPP